MSDQGVHLQELLLKSWRASNFQFTFCFVSLFFIFYVFFIFSGHLPPRVMTCPPITGLWEFLFLSFLLEGELLFFT